MVMLMGDTAMFEDEVNPATSAALDHGLEVTALHNHFFFDQPKVYFMHIGGMGDVHQLAEGIKAVYDKVAQVRASHAAPGATLEGDIASPSSVSAGPIEQVLGKAQSEDGMMKVTIVDGDFAMHEGELQAVLKAMRIAGINIVAIHQHITHQEPRTLFLHCWGKGKADHLAKGVNAALDARQEVAVR